MHNVVESIIFGFREILHAKIMQMALAIGFIVTIVWTIFGYFIWNELLSFSEYFLDLVPFSMLRANSAWVLSSFLWFWFVLITFSLTLAFFGNMILEKVTKAKYGAVSLFIAFSSAVFWTVIWVFKGDYLHSEFVNLLNKLPFQTVEDTLSYIFGFYFIYMAIVATLLLVTSFFSQKLLRGVNERRYNNEQLLHEDEIEATEIRVMDVAIYTVVSFLAFPLFFIPVLNVIVQIILWVWLIKNTLVNDSVALLFDSDEKTNIKKHKGAFLFIAVITSLFNFLPLFNIFGPFFGEITMFHYLKQIKNKNKG